MKPYIGVTDFTSSEQVRYVLEHTSWRRNLHVGVMCSRKQLHGLPTKWADVWPSEEQIHDIFIDDPSVFNVVHYADYEGLLSETTAQDLEMAVKRCGPNVKGLQLDMLWPKVEIVEEFFYANPTINVILQVSAKAMDVHPFWFRSIPFYRDSVEYILLDAGMGQGHQFDVEKYLAKIKLVIEEGGYPEDRIAIAGGLGPYTYNRLEEILEVYPDISCDAQSQLRPSKNSMDPLDPVYAAAYVQGVSSLLDRK